MVDVVYATREQVKAALDSGETARNNAAIDRALRAATASVESQMGGRVFAPIVATRYKDWPGQQQAQPWTLWLDRDELLVLTSLTAGGVNILPGALLEPANVGPPYNRIEMDLSTSYAFSAGSTFQRAVAIGGTFGQGNSEVTLGSIVGAIDAATTSVSVSNSADLGVGSLLRVGTERMIVVSRALLTTSQTVLTPLTATASNTTVAVASGAAVGVGELITIDSERMMVDDVAGNNLTVRRAQDGTVLASHTGSTIYAPRLLTVQRASLGTTAATHADAATLVRWDPPGLINSLTIAEAIAMRQRESAAYAAAGSGSSHPAGGAGEALADLRAQARGTFGFLARSRVL